MSASRSALRTNVYVDGFNLFHGGLQSSPYRWLDLAAFAQASLPGDHIHRIRYFTAIINQRPGHPNATQHQLIYLRALETIANLSIDYGHFLTHKVRMKLVQPDGNQQTAKVWKTEEKGSDVNLATRMLCDAFDGDFDVAVVISNDSDLIPPIRVIRQRFNLPVGVLNPQIGSPNQIATKYPNPKISYALKQEATFYRPIRPNTLASSLFPDQLTDAQGIINKPHGW
ncbi:MAG: NYN domain-containing protein [Candidatus Dormibacteraceae bacterium]